MRHLAAGRVRAWTALAALTPACGSPGYILSQAIVDTGTPGSSTPTTQSSGTTPTTSGGTTGMTGGTTTGSSGTSTGTGGTGTGGTTQPAPSTCSTTTDTFDNFANAALQASCNGCHSGEWNTVAKASAKARALRGSLSSGSMPPGGGLDATVKMRLLTWLNCPLPLP